MNIGDEFFFKRGAYRICGFAIRGCQLHGEPINIVLTQKIKPTRLSVTLHTFDREQIEKLVHSCGVCTGQVDMPGELYCSNCEMSRADQVTKHMKRHGLA